VEVFRHQRIVADARHLPVQSVGWGRALARHPRKLHLPQRSVEEAIELLNDSLQVVRIGSESLGNRGSVIGQGSRGDRMSFLQVVYNDFTKMAGPLGASEFIRMANGL
jgi:hypothetical protein